MCDVSLSENPISKHDVTLIKLHFNLIRSVSNFDKLRSKLHFILIAAFFGMLKMCVCVCVSFGWWAFFFAYFVLIEKFVAALHLQYLVGALHKRIKESFPSSVVLNAAIIYDSIK